MQQHGKPVNGTDPAGSRVQNFKEQVMGKTKRLLDIDSASNGHAEKYSYNDAIEELERSPAFNSRKFLKESRIGSSNLPAKAIALVKTAAGAATNPKEAIKRLVTKKTAGKLARSRPHLSRQADVEFLKAQNDFEQVQHTTSRRAGETLEEEADRLNESERKAVRLRRARADMRVAWVTERHVKRVMTVGGNTAPPFPDMELFEKEDDCGVLELQLGILIGHRILHHTHGFTAQYIDDFEQIPFDFDTLRKHVERLIIVSEPLQILIKDIRHIYRWDDPFRTAKWMLTYWLLWYISHIMTFAFLCIFYNTLKNYYFRSSEAALRESLERSITRGAAALKVSELMDKHGKNDWLQPLIDELGPHIQLQAADLASFLEVLDNFYNFESPRATLATLFFFLSLFFICILGDARFVLRLCWFIFGITFFICWPISSLYPRYRLLVSPFKWVFWDVPNHAEWSFNHLQQRSAFARQIILEQDQ